MSELPRLNGAIKVLEEGKPAFVTFTVPEVSAAVSLAGTPYDGVVFEMEHTPYDVRVLRDCLQYMLDRRQIVQFRELGAGRDAVRADPGQWRRAQPVDRQAGPRHRRLRRDLAACQHGRRGAQRGCRLPLSAAGVAPLLRPARAAWRRTAPRRALLGAHAAGVLRAGRRVAARSAGRDPGRDHVRGGAGPSTTSRRCWRKCPASAW